MLQPVAFAPSSGCGGNTANVLVQQHAILSTRAVNEDAAYQFWCLCPLELDSVPTLAKLFEQPNGAIVLLS